jgi:hypothetical protein
VAIHSRPRVECGGHLGVMFETNFRFTIFRKSLHENPANTSAAGARSQCGGRTDVVSTYGVLVSFRTERRKLMWRYSNWNDSCTKYYLQSFNF